MLERAVDRWDDLDGVGFITAMATGELPTAPHAELLAYEISTSPAATSSSRGRSPTRC